MKGLELSRRFYAEYGRPMIEEQFGDAVERIAVGLVGEGSECFGFDDALSADHDFEPGFCLWLTPEDERAFGFRLERAYAKLPKEFCGYRRSPLSPVGGNRHGVFVIGDFYRRFLGVEAPPRDLRWWLETPTASLAIACNGEVFRDDLGAFSAVRQALLQGYPEDVRRKKIAAHTALLSQAGEYNYNRCLRRGERGAAQLAVFEFVRHAISLIYLLNRAYEPFYKWAYRAMRNLPLFAEAEAILTELTETENTPERAQKKREMMQSLCEKLIGEFQRQGLSGAPFADIGRHAIEVQNGISDATLRNMHVMDGI